MSSKPNHHRVRRIQFIGRLSFIAGLVVAGCLIFGAPDNPRERSDAEASAEDAEHLVSLASSQPTPTSNRSVGTRPIDEIRVGERVLARNPEVTDAERTNWEEPDWSEWIHLSLVLPKEDGSELKIEILRPESWVREQVSYIVREQETTQSNLAPLAPNSLGGEGPGVRGNAHDPEADADLVPLSPLRPLFRDVALTAAVLEAADAELLGLTVEMDLPEMGASGTAVVTDINPCPPIQEGKGQPVTATFSHPPSTQVLDVRFEGETDSIGVTDNHLFWSVDRQQFIPIGQMEIGEQVQTYFGHTKRIAGQLARPGPHVVYNLEVYGEHVYFVGEQGLLAHNSYNAPNPGGAPVQSLLRGNAKRIDASGFNTTQKGALGELRTSFTMRRAGFQELPARLPGNQGFDGVFIKNGTSGAISDIVITESKFATNGVRRLTQTRTMGRQLSPQWIDANIQRMLNSADPAIVRTGMTLDANRSLIRAKAAVTNASGVQRFSSP